VDVAVCRPQLLSDYRDPGASVTQYLPSRQRAELASGLRVNGDWAVYRAEETVTPPPVDVMQDQLFHVIPSCSRCLFDEQPADR
jgi:hypothetical protein